MIIVKIKGGLGNQLFQYAAGRCLSHIHQVDLKLDLSYINADPKGAYTKRELELDLFNVNYTIANDEEVRIFLKHAGNKYIRTLNRKFPSLFSNSYLTESGVRFHPNFHSFPKNTYIDGFWQSEKYFSHIRSILLKEFSLKAEPSVEATNLLEDIQQTNSVSIHIRRGDYVSNSGINSFHGTIDTSYYEQSLNKLRKERNVDKVFVFSDDISWCRQNLKFDLDMRFVEFSQPVAGCIEMIIMSKCRHNIIANSSFSWWAAWLNVNPEKTVIAPKKWFQTINNPDIYPPSWIQL